MLVTDGEIAKAACPTEIMLDEHMAQSPGQNKHTSDDNYVKTPLAVARAADDLRRAVPVLLTQPDGRAIAVIPTEMLSKDRFARLKALGAANPVLLMTQERAAVLKIMHKGAGVVRLAIPDWLGPDVLASLADPTEDLAFPVRGPYQTLQSQTPQLDGAALALMRTGHLLPSAIALDLDEAAAQRLVAEHHLVRADASAVLGHDDQQGHDLQVVARAPVPLAEAEQAEIWAFRAQSGGPEHLAIVVGDPDRAAPVLTRLHSECFTGDLLGSLKCDCGDQLRGAISELAAEGSGILLYLAQEGRGIGLIAKLKAYALQAQGHDTVDANLRLGFAVDERVFAPAARMLNLLGVDSVRLMTNNPEKVDQLVAAGIKVTERVAHTFPSNRHNDLYLKTKRDRTGHFL